MHIEHTELASFNVLPVMKFNVMWAPPKNLIYTHSCKLVRTIRAFLYCRHVNFHKTGMTFSSRIIVLVLIKCNCVQTKQQTTHHR